MGQGMRIGIDLLWVRHGKCGGTEAYIRNLLDGFARYCTGDEFLLFAARDNAQAFSKYRKCRNMRLLKCPVGSAVRWVRFAWENLYLAGQAQKEQVDAMLIPVYSKPVTFRSRIPYVTVIHDLQAYHFPEYFSLPKRLFLKGAWWHACKTSAQVVAVSDFCRRDLILHFPFVEKKVRAIYNPVASAGRPAPFAAVGEKYGICAGEYFYCVSSMLPHKNLITIMKAMAALKRMGETPKLVLSGVGGRHAEFAAAVRGLGLGDTVIQTGFVPDAERDCLYENCEAFLFPSIFEGFGMPPIEAMRKGRPVVMTRESCLEEVTCKKAIYVEEPGDVKEWVQKIRLARGQEARPEAFPQYGLRRVVGQMMEVFHDSCT